MKIVEVKDMDNKTFVCTQGIAGQRQAYGDYAVYKGNIGDTIQSIAFHGTKCTVSEALTVFPEIIKDASVYRK